MRRLQTFVVCPYSARSGPTDIRLETDQIHDYLDRFFMLCIVDAFNCN